MSSFFNLILDTLAPASPSISINGGAAYTVAQLVTLTIGTTDTPTTGYQMKVWGDVDPANDANVQTTEGASIWITYNTSLQVKLSAAEGAKNLYLKIQDNVLNVSAQASASITLDTTAPVSTISIAPSVTTVSKQTGKRTCSFSFQSDSIFDNYAVMVVPATNSLHSAGTLIGTANGSVNMSGSVGNYPATTNINCLIDGADLQAASSGDGTKIIKVFVQDKAGNWSVA